MYWIKNHQFKLFLMCLSKWYLTEAKIPSKELSNYIDIRKMPISEHFLWFFIIYLCIKVCKRLWKGLPI